MQTDRERWDRKYGPEGLGRELAAPDAFVLRALDQLEPCGRALDLASGAGRHARRSSTGIGSCSLLLLLLLLLSSSSLV